MIRDTPPSSHSPHLKPFILGVGDSSNPVKNHELLLRAYYKAQREGDLAEDLVIIGEAGHANIKHFLKLIESLGLEERVCVVGWINNRYDWSTVGKPRLPRPKLPGQHTVFDWFRHATLFVSSSRFESCPLVISEMIACGTPVISTDCPGAGELMRRLHLQNYLVPVSDIDALAEKITATLQNPPVLDDAYEKLKLFAPKDIAKQYLDFIRKTLDANA